jgi:low temperature requirement protein LtrA
LRVGEGAEGERHATWLELFHDLLFAAVVAQLTFELSQDLSGSENFHSPEHTWNFP